MLREPFLAGFAGAMDRVFLVAALVVLPAFVLSFFLKEVKLRMESGLEAAAADRRRLAELRPGEPSGSELSGGELSEGAKADARAQAGHATA